MSESELDSVLRELNKRFGEKTVISGDEIVNLVVDRIPTGSLSLDIETGGGYPCGRVVELFGRESAGKTFMALKAVAEAQKLGKIAVWIDVEGSFDPVWSALLGVDLKKLKLSRPETGELACDILDAVIRSGECGILVLDSTAALIPIQDINKGTWNPTKDGGAAIPEQLGDRAVLVNRLIRKLHAALNMKVGEDRLPNDCVVIFINQVREKIGSYGNPETTTGGCGLRHAASIRIDFHKSWIKASQAEDEKRIIGQTIKFTTVKNKTFPPYRRGEFDIYTDGGAKGQIDTIREVFTYSVLSGLIEQNDKTYLLGKEKRVGKEKMVAYLRENPTAVEDLKEKIVAKFLPKD